MRNRLIAYDTYRRLDTFVAGSSFGLTRSEVQRLLAEGCIKLNGETAQPSRKVYVGDLITLTIPPTRVSDIEPEPIDLDIVYEDHCLLVINKPEGMVVHPGPGHSRSTLVNAVLAWSPNIKGIGGESRPGIVHRLDKDTSGLIVVCKDQRAHNSIAGQFKARVISKEYTALTVGNVSPSSGVIDLPIGRDTVNRKRMAIVASGRAAVTKYRSIRSITNREGIFSLLSINTETGRTHQIRVHFAAIGNPLFGDLVYGKRSQILSRQFLHASFLGFRHPETGQYLEFTCELPYDLRRTLGTLEGRN